MSHAGRLRQEIQQRAADWAHTHSLPSYASRGGVTFFEPDGPDRHGNFHPDSYRAIQGDVHWWQRLQKLHTRRSALPVEKAEQARETDSCNSSDALLLNIFCHPDSLAAISSQLNVVGSPEFGVGGSVPRRVADAIEADESELDLIFRGVRGRITLIGEAKLTEGDFSRKRADVVESYCDIEQVFHLERLERLPGGDYDDYQLIRNLLAARFHRAPFVLFYDARRPDLWERFDRVVAAAQPRQLPKSRAVTWQQVAGWCTPDLQTFLSEKYGIEPEPFTSLGGAHG